MPQRSPFTCVLWDVEEGLLPDRSAAVRRDPPPDRRGPPRPLLGFGADSVLSRATLVPACALIVARMSAASGPGGVVTTSSLPAMLIVTSRSGLRVRTSLRMLIPVACCRCREMARAMNSSVRCANPSNDFYNELPTQDTGGASTSMVTRTPQLVASERARVGRAAICRSHSIVLSVIQDGESSDRR